MYRIILFYTGDVKEDFYEEKSIYPFDLMKIDNFFIKPSREYYILFIKSYSVIKILSHEQNLNLIL